MSVTTHLDEASARFVEKSLTPRREYLSEKEQLRRRVEALETRHRVIADTVAGLPTGQRPRRSRGSSGNSPGSSETTTGRSLDPLAARTGPTPRSRP